MTEQAPAPKQPTKLIRVDISKPKSVPVPKIKGPRIEYKVVVPKK